MLAELISTVADGVAIGAVYGALALSLVLIYRTTGILNFAQGEMAMFGTFGIWSLIAAGVPIWPAIILGLALAFLGGTLVERYLMRPVQTRDPVLSVKNTLGLYLICNGLASFIWGADLRDFPSIFGNRVVRIAGAPVSMASIGMICVIAVSIGLLYLLLQHTRLGLSMRAAAANPTSSSLSGVNTASMFALGWGMAAALATLAGVLVAPILLLDANLMTNVLVYAFAAVVLGGLESMLGAVLGGLLIGLTETFATTYVAAVGTDFKILVPLGLIMVLLVFRPNGLLGRAEERAV